MARPKKLQPEQIIPILKRHESGERTQDLCREMGVSTATFYKWKSRFGGLEVSDARRLKSLEDENRKLKHIVADLTIDNHALKAINSKNFLSPK